MGVPPLHRADWLRAVAALRQAYLAAHNNVPPLPWYANSISAADREAGEATGTPAAATATAVCPPLVLRVAVHVRRGDVIMIAPHRLHRFDTYLTPLMRRLASSFGAVRRQWDSGPAGHRRQLAFSVHIMSESCPREGRPGFVPEGHPERGECELPISTWRAIMARDAGASLEVHVDTEPLVRSYMDVFRCVMYVCIYR